MNGRDLVLVVVVAGVVGAAAGIGARLATETPATDDGRAEILDRLGRAEAALARAAEDQKAAKESVGKLSERVTETQLQVGGLLEEKDRRGAAADAAVAGAEPSRPGRARRIQLPDGKSVQVEGGNVQFAGERGAVFALDVPQIGEEAGKQMRAVAEGMRLRMLPEAERWKKAQEDLHLSDAQVDALKRAGADRDAAIKDATQVETKTDGGTQQLTFRRIDPAKSAAAQQEYERRVNDTLDADQEKTWKEKGYDHAFGGARGATSIAIVSSMDFTTEKPEQK